MKRVVGFALFWIALGLLIGIIITNLFVKLVIILLCVLIAYNLFCC